MLAKHGSHGLESFCRCFEVAAQIIRECEARALGNLFVLGVRICCLWPGRRIRFQGLAVVACPLGRSPAQPDVGLVGQRHLAASSARRTPTAGWLDSSRDVAFPAPKGQNMSAQGRGDASTASIAVALGRISLNSKP